MTNNKALSIFNQLRPVTVGFDNVFDHFESMFDDGFMRMPTATNFPPYNIVKTGEYTYDVELALAGFNKKDIEVEYELPDGTEVLRLSLGTPGCAGHSVGSQGTGGPDKLASGSTAQPVQ